ncbi:MAG TPA: T9SS type A sorting domain-containing protein [Parafilimonas sp.]|nr:T9SS type A sorting domain-containing protein [Parafilimonas sp.]
MKLIKAIRIVFLLAITLPALLKAASAQLVNNGTSITITDGAVLYTGYSFTNAVNGNVINRGSIITDSSIINEQGATLSGHGIYSMQANFTNKGTYNNDSSMLEFTGALNSSIKNKGGKIYLVQIAKNENKYVNLLDNETVLNGIMFLNDKNWIKLGNHNLTLGNNCVIEDYSNKRFIITNGTGILKKLNVKNAPFTFPVGFDKKTYNALTITENGTPEDYSVRCLENALLNGSSGIPVSSKGIDASWFVERKTEAGANAVIKAGWKTTDELTDFDYTKCMVVRYAANKWDFKINQAGTATGNTYRSISRSGFSSFGYFTVLSGANPGFGGMVSATGDENAFAVADDRDMQPKVYPTIVQNNININMPVSKNGGKMNIRIIDGTGKAVWQKQNADYGSQKIFLPNLAPGMYNVLIEADDTKFVQKIIIAR